MTRRQREEDEFEPARPERGRFPVTLCRVVPLAVAVLLSSCGTAISPWIPALPDPQSNGGRTQAITVNPTNANDIVIATQFGGLWRTRNRGGDWRLLTGLNEVFVNDVQSGTDGRTLVATVGYTSHVDHHGGIWVSRDNGDRWTSPTTAPLGCEHGPPGTLTPSPPESPGSRPRPHCAPGALSTRCARDCAPCRG